MTTETTKPDPTHITLHLRHARSSTLISLPTTAHITPTLKQSLLVALHGRGLTHLPGSGSEIPPLPSDPDDPVVQKLYDLIDLGVLIDRKDPTKGWIDLALAEIKDPKTGRKLGGEGSVLNETVLGAGLKDGDSIAYRILSEEGDEKEGWEGVVELPSLEEEEAGDEEMGGVGK